MHSSAIQYRLFTCLSLFLILFQHCTPPPEGGVANSKPGVVNLDLRNPQIQQLYRLRDERKVDSLVQFLGNRDATLRYLAALSFASIRDTNTVAALIPLLADGTEDVRIAAAFALGQIGSAGAEKPLTDAF